MRVLAALMLMAFATAAKGQADMAGVEVTISPIREGLHLVQGRGGNIIASVGSDGVFIVDDQYAPLSARIKAAIGTVSDAPVRFVINTHWHGDHTGGNENFGKAGAVIVAHDNVRQRMSTDQFMARFDRTVPASPREALPVLTFADGVTLHLNDTVRVIHVANAHTDGDAFVRFERANVLHLGDVYFNGLYPFIDVGSGGSIDGLLAALATAIQLSDAGTVIVPGHGPLSDLEGLRAYRDMLKGFRDTIATMKAEGRSLSDIQTAKPTAAFDAVWGGQFISADALVESIYASL